MGKLDLNKAVARLEKSVGLVHAGLVDFKEVTPDIHKVIVAFSGEGNKEDRYRAVAKIFENQATPIEGSFRELPGTYKKTAVGFVSKNAESRLYTKEMAASGRYKTLAGNDLLDTEDDSLWEVTSSGNDKFIVRNGREDLSELVALASKKNEMYVGRRPLLANLQYSGFEKDYASYIHPRTREVSHGYILEAYMDENDEEVVEILDQESVEPVEVNPELLIESATLNDDDTKTMPKEVVAKYDMGDKASLKAYYAKMFSYSPDYIQKMNSIIDGHSYV